MMEDKVVRKLRQQLDAALAKQRDDLAIDLLGKLMEADATAPRWPQKRGELYRKLGKRNDAIECYAKAADLYVDQGFLARAVALAKTIIDLDARRIDVLQRIDPQAARQLHSVERPSPMRHAAVREVASEGAARHAALLPEDDEVVPQHHPAVLVEDHAKPLGRDPSRVKAARKNALAHMDAGKPTAGPRGIPIPRPPRTPSFSGHIFNLAEELTVAPDRKAHETRFSNAPPARALSVDLTEADLELRLSSAPPESPSAAKLSQLPLFPLFAELPQQALVDMIKESEVIEFADGAKVVRFGDAADALYGIVEGQVEVVVPGQPFKLALGEGDVFGESSLLAGEKRRADVIARGPLVVLRIGRQTFNMVIAAVPQMAEVLLELLTRRLLSNLLQSSPLFQEFDARGWQELARNFEIRRAPKGMVLSEIGKVMDGLYINLTGELEVTESDGKEPEVHGAGTMFGQASLLTHEPSAVRVRALANMLVLRLPTQPFHNIAMQYPGLLAHVSDLSASNVAKVMT